MNRTITIALLITVTAPISTFARYEAITEDSGGGGFTSKQNNSQTPTTPSSSRKTYSGEFDSTCVVTALQLREDALAAAFAKFTAAHSSLMSARKAALLTALEKPTARERSDARKAAWSDFRKASKLNHTELKKARQIAWSAYKSTTGTCKGGRAELSGDVASGSSVESQ
jgi:hypothetical protein